MQLDYHVHQRPGSLNLILQALQWLALWLPGIVLIGAVVGHLDIANQGQAVYLQGLTWVCGLTMLGQQLYGHRLPVLSGPSAVLLVAVLATPSAQQAAVPSSLALGGLLLLAVGVIRPLQQRILALFSEQLVALVLILIPITLLPAVSRLCLQPVSTSSTVGAAFSLAWLLLLVAAGQGMPARWRNFVVLLSILLGSLVYGGFVGGTEPSLATATADHSGHLGQAVWQGPWHPGVVFTFVLSALAVAVNEVGSVRSLYGVLPAPRPQLRLGASFFITGLGNIMAGVLGVIGPVSLSISPGVLAATRSASRWPLGLAALLLLGLGFFPDILGLLTRLPGPVVGSTLLYIFGLQFCAGLRKLAQHQSQRQHPWGMDVSLPLLVGILCAFYPSAAQEQLPVWLQPVAGNGFVTAVLLALGAEVCQGLWQSK